MSYSGRGGIGLTLTGGIQNIVAIPPLSTVTREQCSDQVSSTLDVYVYDRLSIFGSLGVVSVGF